MENMSIPTMRVQCWKAVGAVLGSSLLVDRSRGGGVESGRVVGKTTRGFSPRSIYMPAI